MKTHSPRKTCAAMTLVEVLVVLIVVVILVALVIPMRSRPVRTPLISCLNNAKQIDLGFLLYAQENKGEFTIRTSITNGGTMEYLERNQTFPHYQKLAGYIYNVGVFICPADTKRQPSPSYETLADTNLSYFLNADASLNDAAKSIMAGERNLQADGHAVPHGTFAFRTNTDLTWTPELHRDLGILAFADGHAESCRKTNLNSFLQSQGLVAMRFAVP